MPRSFYSHLYEQLYSYPYSKAHAAQLAAANATARVAALRPTGGVLSVWSEVVAGFGAGCHMHKDGPPLPAAAVPWHALQPLADRRVLVANEAFGPIECWAEGSLAMAENVVHTLGLGRPEWMPEDVWRRVIFPRNASAARAAPPRRRAPSDWLLARAGL